MLWCLESLHSTDFGLFGTVGAVFTWTSSSSRLSVQESNDSDVLVIGLWNLVTVVYVNLGQVCNEILGLGGKTDLMLPLPSSLRVLGL